MLIEFEFDWGPSHFAFWSSFRVAGSTDSPSIIDLSNVSCGSSLLVLCITVRLVNIEFSPKVDLLITTRLCWVDWTWTPSFNSFCNYEQPVRYFPAGVWLSSLSPSTSSSWTTSLSKLPRATLPLKRGSTPCGKVTKLSAFTIIGWISYASM